MNLIKKYPGIVASIIVGLALVTCFFTWLLFMHTETVEPGHHAVIIDKPYFFGHNGVRDEPLKEGRVLLFKTSTVEVVRVTPQSIAVKVDDYSSKDNILLDFETTIQYRITDPVKLIDGFGSGWFDNNIRNQYMAIVREAVKKKTMTEMMSDVTASQEIDNEVTAKLQEMIAGAKLPLQVVSVSMGRAQPNANVLAQMNETAAQQQRKKTLIEAEAAEIQRKREQIAKADADNAYRNAIGLNPNQFIQLESIKRYSDACAKSTCIITSGQAPALTVPVAPAK